MARPPLYVLVRLWIHSDRETEFDAYERKVSRIMVRYGGVIECAIRTLRPSDNRADEPSKSTCSGFRAGIFTTPTWVMRNVVR